MKTRRQYGCGICKTWYDTEKEARDCEAQGIDKPVARVGDIVFAHAGFGWFDGDPAWVSNPGVKERANPAHGNCFGECCTFRFYYVVTAIDQENHRVRYHLATKAMTDKTGYRQGFTFNEHHIKPKPVKPVPIQVEKSGRDLIGQKAEHLL